MKNLTAVVLATCLAACGTESGPVESTGFDELPAEAIMTNVRHPMFSEGVRSAVGQYDSVYYYTDSTRVRGVDVEIFGPAGQRTGELTAESGVIQNESQAMVARGSVRLETAEGDRTIESDEMHYDPTTRELWSDVETCMVEGNRVSRGSSFRSDDAFNSIRISQLRQTTGTSCS